LASQQCTSPEDKIFSVWIQERKIYDINQNVATPRSIFYLLQKYAGINSKDTKQIIRPFYTFVPEKMLGQSFKQFIKKKRFENYHQLKVKCLTLQNVILISIFAIQGDFESCTF
jgi:hypothetical protein